MNQREREEPEVIEPEVLPPQRDTASRDTAPASRDARGRIMLILVGLLLDALDLLTFGPLGIRFGFFVGFVAAFVLFSLVGVSLKRRFLCSLLAGIYCLVPGTERFPLGTVLAAMMGLR